ncbi:hypothetical protein ACEU2D_18215 [Brevibacillus laterosporus]|uniref:hypothetical protein n=1 Tax=Brevibacillus laterosporus TaxID=1465 RepID=UPI0035A69608
MNVGELEIRVAKAKEKVEKCKATISRHEGQLAKKLAVISKHGITLENMEEKKWSGGIAGTGGSAYYWDICAVERKQDDIKRANYRLKEAETILDKWQAKLNIEFEKQRFLSEQAPDAIIEFLNRWKEKARDWYIKAHARYQELRAELEVATKDADERFLAQNPEACTWGRDYESFIKGDKEIKRISGAIAMLGGTVATLATYRQKEERLAWLERMLEEDRKAKLFDLIHRINDVVGTIEDASQLRVSQKGNLDGVITGEKGKAKIETIGAGGYNIQCFHYRTLVHKL